MEKWVKWNIRVQHEVVFLRLSLLWGFSEHVFYLDTIRCYFAWLSIDVCSLDILWDICLWSYIFHPSKCCYRTKCKWYSLLLRNNLFVLARRATVILLWAKLLGCEKLIKRGLKLLSRVSWFFVSLNLKFSKPPRSTLPRPFQSRRFSLATSTRVGASVLSLWTCNMMRWFTLESPVVERKYVFTRFKAENGHSPTALVAAGAPLPWAAGCWHDE